ncbi:cyclic nucleotide-binding domain-containing protein [Peijinzhouia sedimentorum]|tara:strand:- start:282 stop:803 length:522 start_codon:yes stop_codon:yes gene_type:complete
MINPFKKRYTDKELVLFRFLRKIKVFERLNNKELSVFLPYLYLRHYTAEEVVFFRNDPANAFYIVKSGRVALTVDVNDTFEALTEITANKAFGDNSLLENAQRIYTAIVKSESADIYVVPHVNLMEIFQDHIEIQAKVMTSLSELYNGYTQNLFRAYQASFGFFDLSQTYKNP